MVSTQVICVVIMVVTGVCTGGVCDCKHHQHIYLPTGGILETAT